MTTEEWNKLRQHYLDKFKDIDFPSLLPKQAKIDECITEKCITNSNGLYISPQQMN